MYISRTIQDKIFKTSHFFPVLLVNGPRQSGKTTVLKHCMQATNEPQRNYVTLDTLENRELAVRDPALFLQRFPAPLLIDEIQYAPELLPYIKAIVDEKNQAGMYWITGSQQFRLMKNVSESLAGRIGILNLQGFSQSEKFGCPATPVFLPDSNYLEQQSAKRPKQDLRTIYEIIWKGSFPKLWTAENEQWKTYYDSLVQTYLERDIRDLTSISDELIFVKFLKVIAARTGQLINFTEVAKDIGVSQPTVKSWLSVLQTSGLVYLLQPYYAEVVLKSIKQNTASAATRSGCSRAKP
ncbi:MAG: AAA family ATPase, partial [Planctomycetaceae bacterium]|nr:AAA family ATPase [Planctomycetaceae bacterium]